MHRDTTQAHQDPAHRAETARERRGPHALASALTTVLTLAMVLAVLGWISNSATEGSHEPASASSGESTPDGVNRILRDDRITESSGLARSGYPRGVLYTHNDSGGDPRVFAIGKRGQTRAVLTLRGARAHDWEDISTGPDRSLWVGDIGDNARKRAAVTVYRFTEPRRIRTRSVRPTKYSFAYPDGSRDAEALLVHPRTGRVFIVSKASRDAGIYVAPKTLSTTRVNKLTRIADAPPLVTAGTFSRDGSRVVLGTYTQAHILRSVRSSATRVINLPHRRQGESLEVDRRWNFILAGSEGSSSPVHQVSLSSGDTSRPTAAAMPTRDPAEPSRGSDTRATETSPSPAPEISEELQSPAPAPDAATEDQASTEGTCPKAPDYRRSGTLFGVSLSTSRLSLAESLAKQEQNFGHLPVVRTFDPSIPPADAWSRRAPTLGPDRTIVTSFRMPPRDVLAGKYDAQIRAYFREAPQNRILYSYFHEADAEIAKTGDFTASEFRAAFRHVVDIASSLCRPNLYPTLILTGWTTQSASGRHWSDFYPGNRYVSVMSWDPYNGAGTRPTSYPEPSKLYASVLQASEAIGKPWGIAETGSARISGDESGTGRAAWLRKVGQYFADHGATYVTYFQSTRDGDFELRDDPSINAWRYWVGRSS